MLTPDTSRVVWRKSSYSAGCSNCVEVASDGRWVAIRDSKNPLGCVLVVGTDAFAQFTAAIKAGVFDLA
jgi:hypothetical protein